MGSNHEKAADSSGCPLSTFHTASMDGFDGAIPWTTIMKIALMSPGSPFSMEGYRGNDQLAEAFHYTERAISPALQLFAANRVQMIELFALLPDSLSNTVSLISPQGTQPISVERMIAILATHAKDHTQEIRAKLEGR